MKGQYSLNGHEPVPCDDLLAWAQWYESADRHVANDKVGDVSVSTVFLGLDHRWPRDGNDPPLLFETMIFGGEHDQYQERYATWDEAVEGHQRCLQLVKG